MRRHDVRTPAYAHGDSRQPPRRARHGAAHRASRHGRDGPCQRRADGAVDTTTAVAGNLAFHEAAIGPANAAIEDAVAALFEDNAGT